MATVGTEGPYMILYQPGTADFVQLSNALATLQNSTPGMVADFDRDAGVLAVIATTSGHQAVSSAITKMQRDAAVEE